MSPAVIGTWVTPFVAYLFVLNARIVAVRLRHETYLGEKTNNSFSKDKGYDPLLVATSCHRNFLENVPLGLVLATIAELNGANKKVLNISLAALFLLRIIHVEFGLRGKGALAAGRPLGYYGTMSFLGGMAGYATYLVKGYWGF